MRINQFLKILFAVLINAVLPIAGFYIVFLIWFYTNRDESVVLYYIGAGIIPTAGIAGFFLPATIKHVFRFTNKSLAAILLFYSISIYGFCMGFPGFLLLISLISGMYIGAKSHLTSTPPQTKQKQLQQAALFVASIMVICCVLTLLLAAHEQDIVLEVTNMLHLPLQLTKFWLMGFLTMGAILITGVQYWLVYIAARQTKKLISKSHLHPQHSH